MMNEIIVNIIFHTIDLDFWKITKKIDQGH